MRHCYNEKHILVIGRFFLKKVFLHGIKRQTLQRDFLMLSI